MESFDSQTRPSIKVLCAVNVSFQTKECQFLTIEASYVAAELDSRFYRFFYGQKDSQERYFSYCWDILVHCKFTEVFGIFSSARATTALMRKVNKENDCNTNYEQSPRSWSAILFKVYGTFVKIFVRLLRNNRHCCLEPIWFACDRDKVATVIVRAVFFIKAVSDLWPGRTSPISSRIKLAAQMHLLGFLE